MKKLVFINACIREEASRTFRLATPLLAELRKAYEITEISLAHAALSPVTAELFHERGTRGISEYDVQTGRLVAEADRVVVAAPFWDMSFPSVLKVFFEHISVAGLTFLNNEDGTTRGNCKAEKLLYITTRGMEIPTDSPLDQGTSYMKALGWLWGIPEIRTVAAWGMDVLGEETAEARLQEAIKTGLTLCEEF